jgi:hypothetical protein
LLLQILNKFTRRAKLIRIIGDPDNQRLDKQEFHSILLSFIGELGQLSQHSNSQRV